MKIEPRTITSSSNTMTLTQVVTRLEGNEVVDGIVLIGSTGTELLSPASDYDLIVVLAEMPAPLHVALTYIDQRLTDIIFVSVAAIERILTHEQLLDDVDTMEGKLIRWLQAGQIAFDRSGRLQRAQRKVQTGQWLRTANASAMYAAWFSINYNVQQTRRMCASDDPVYLTAVDFRLLYSLAELGVMYFRVRRLPWEGEKKAIRYLAVHDPNYLELFRKCLTETDRRRKVQLYIDLAELTLAPLGGLWEDGRTAVQFHVEHPWEPGMDKLALQFLENLITGSQS